MTGAWATLARWTISLASWKPPAHRLRWGLVGTLHAPVDSHSESQVGYGSATGILKKHCQSP